MLHYYSTKKDSRALFMVDRTLDMMQRGGIYDHLGGGYSRYSVDENWLVPHFEKMLYDNALLIYSYLEAWQVTKKHLYREICEEIITYILRDMTHRDGGFYSAEDADSEGHEGRFYTWSLEEVQKALGREESPLFCDFYDITEEGNFEGRSILHTKLRLEEFAHARGIEPSDLAMQLQLQREILWKVREGREHPLKDDKILSSWNGLMIFSLAESGCALGKKEYVDAAVKAAKFIKANLWKGDHLLRRWREGEAFFDAGLDEYAFLLKGLISLFETTGKAEWLEWALEIAEILSLQFKAEGGAFYQTDDKEQNVILRKTQFSDGAEPSGNAVHCENLLRLYQITQNAEFLEEAEDILKAVKKFIDNYSPGYCYHIMNLNRYYDVHAPTIVIALNDKESHKEELKRAIFSNFIPHKTVIWRYEKDEQLFKLLPFLKVQGPQNEQTTLYICHEGVCSKPLTEKSEMLEAIQKL
jgi:uncharacterized protein YyaL (SSP411 family)